MKRLFILALVIVMALSVLSGCSKAPKQSYDSLYAKGAPDTFTYAVASDDCYGYVLKEPLRCSGLICCYYALVEEFVMNHPEYEDDMTVSERIDFRKKVLDEINPSTGEAYKVALQKDAVKEYEQMVVFYVRSVYKNMGLTVEKINAIENQWKNYGIKYYNTLKDIYPEVTSPDLAMKKIIGCNVMDAITYKKMQAMANDIASARFYELICSNTDFENYYKENINKYRLVETRAVYFEDEAEAKKVKSLMETRPEDIDNLAKAYNGKKYLAKSNGIVMVNSDCNKVPESVKQWAYTQTEDTLFEKHGNIELLKGEDGWYLLMCEDIHGFDVSLGDQVYKAVAHDYKSKLMDDYILEVKALQEYELRSMDYDKAYRVLSEVY